MKRSAFVYGIFLIAGIFAASCAPESTPSQNVTTGVLGTVTSQPGGQGSVTVVTPQGNTTLPVTSNTTLELNGQVCTIDQLDALEAANVSYNCTSVYYMDENGQIVTVGVNVTKITK